MGSTSGTPGRRRATGRMMTDSFPSLPSRKMAAALGCHTRGCSHLWAGTFHRRSHLPVLMFQRSRCALPLAERTRRAALGPAGDTSRSSSLPPGARASCRASPGDGATGKSVEPNNDGCCCPRSVGQISKHPPHTQAGDVRRFLSLSRAEEEMEGKWRDKPATAATFTRRRRNGFADLRLFVVKLGLTILPSIGGGLLVFLRLKLYVRFAATGAITC
jgi:hypothetical protein